ncbi:MAG: hypothetical protein ABFE08_22910 [Armatimonadia bacterium]
MKYLAPLLAVLMVGPLFAQGGTTLFGGSGGAVLPTADLLGKKLFDVSLDWLNTDDDSTVPLRVLYGATDNLEVGGMWSFNNASDVWGLNAKLGTRFLSGAGAGTAVGIMYDKARDIDTKGWQVYAVHTRQLANLSRTPIRGSLGVNWTRLDFFDDNEDAFRIFGSLEGTLSNGLELGVELQSASGDLGDEDPLSSIYGRYRYDDRWTIQAGFTNAAPGGLFAGDDHNLFIGASYAFGASGSRRQVAGASYSVCNP